MKEKIGTYKWLMIAICMIGCDVGWNIYQNQSIKGGMELHSANSEYAAAVPIQEKEPNEQDLSTQETEKPIENVSLSQIQHQEKEWHEVNEVHKEEKVQEVPVYICGAVQKPGVYYVSSKAIVNDVIACSGGLADEADETAINLASPIQPYQKIIVPKIGEEIDKLEDSYENRERTEIIDVVPNIEMVNENLPSTYVKQEVGLVNINTATKEELMSLNGIGAVKAESIIAYRQENGGFHSIDEIMQISGIGEKTFERIKQFITT